MQGPTLLLQFDFLIRILYNYLIMTRTLPVTKAREELTGLVERADKHLDEFIITVNGRPAAVLVSAAEYESWRETEEILGDKELMKGIKEGEEDFRKGNFLTFENFKKELKSHVQASDLQTGRKHL